MFQFFFGKSLQPRGLAKTLCGSPLYMAQEIMQLQKYDAKVIFTFSICKNLSIFSHNLLLLTSTKYAGRSLECLFHSLSTCDWSVYSSLSCYILLSQLMFLAVCVFIWNNQHYGFDSAVRHISNAYQCSSASEFVGFESITHHHKGTSVTNHNALNEALRIY